MHVLDGTSPNQCLVRDSSLFPLYCTIVLRTPLSPSRGQLSTVYMLLIYGYGYLGMEFWAGRSLHVQ